MRLAVFFGAVVLGTVLSVGVFVGAQSNGTTLIHGCVANNSGALRVVASPDACTRKESALSWNMAGPVGPAGPAGPTGPIGPQGPQGDPGPTGAGALRVMDAVGNEVGSFLFPNIALRTVAGGAIVALPVLSDGFRQSQGELGRIYFLQPGCGGPAYMRGFTEIGALVSSHPAFVTAGGYALWASEPFQDIHAMSGKTILANGGPDDWPCNVGEENVSAVGTLNVIDLPTLGLVPPFHIE